MFHAIIRLILITSTLLSCNDDARILGVFPYPSQSHQIVFHALSKKLVTRGHELVVFTTHPEKNLKLENYTQMDISSINVGFKKRIDFFKTGKQGLWAFLRVVYEYAETISDITLSHPEMQRIIAPNSTEKFDLIITQCLYNDATYALSMHLNTPMIGVSSMSLLAMHLFIFGNPLLAATNPDSISGISADMNLWDRTVNLYYCLRQIYEYLYVVLPSQDKVVRKHFGNDLPYVQELSKNFSLLLVNTHPFYHESRSLVPSIIQIGGCRSNPPKKNLPQDLKKILDDSKYGFIYFSLGSNIKSSQLPTKVRNTILETFKELPYTVIWKFETDELTEIPSNVFIRKWLPQQEILAHPKIVLFMYQGGLQSTEEAIDNGVPMLSFPLITDQYDNANIVKKLGLGQKMILSTLDKVSLKLNIFEIINTTSYKENTLKYRNLLRDLPYHPMDRAVWWIEHVIRHRGATHLRNKSRNLEWYKNELVDITAILAVCFLTLLYCKIVILRWIFRKVGRSIQRARKARIAKKQE